MSTTSPARRVAVLGAGGRVGRAVTAALLPHGLHVEAVLRQPDRHDLPPHPRLRVVPGDAQRPAELASTLRAVDALVLAVTPFSAPPPSFDDFDLDYFAAIVAGIDATWRAPRRRLVAVGLAATLTLDSGTVFMDDPTLFPPALTPFAQAHARHLPALAATTLDWAVLTPPAGFGAPDGSPAGQGYRLVAEPLTREQATTTLTYDQYARAVADELVRPSVHAARVAVLSRA
ncbi:NAD(P)H-binding protein [Micromonospora lupini]|uniref:NAD(P)-dependent oxidoreductase n=1 Tax=Micromonospora lupini TaxID=285679 RepID=UPI0033DD6F27